MEFFICERALQYGEPEKRVRVNLSASLRLELSQNFCYRRGGVKGVEKIRCARSDCYRGRNG